MAPDIFVRILRGMGACRKKPAQPASGTLSWMTPSETLLRLCLGGFGKIFAKQRLLLAFVRFHGSIFETEKPFENVCTTRGLPCIAHLASHPTSLTYRSPVVHLSFTCRSPRWVCQDITQNASHLSFTYRSPIVHLSLTSILRTSVELTVELSSRTLTRPQDVHSAPRFKSTA